MCDPLPSDTRQKTNKRIETSHAKHYTKMLTQQLRELEEDGVITRIVYNQVPPKVEYELSEYGQSLEGILHSLCEWGETHITKVYGDKFSVLEKSVLNDNLK